MGIYDRQESITLNTSQTIVIIGAGGIGYWVSKFAAMSGINKIYIFDDDIYEEHNLNRIDIPPKFIGRNKAEVAKIIINNIRPDCDVYAFPFRLTENHPIEGSFLVDCTDELKSQENNQKIAHSKGMKYLKSGYNGTHVSINDKVAQWGEAPDGYTKIPSWVVPATIIASMTVAKILKYKDKEMSCDIENLFLNL